MCQPCTNTSRGALGKTKSLLHLIANLIVRWHLRYGEHCISRQTLYVLLDFLGLVYSQLVNEGNLKKLSFETPSPEELATTIGL